MLTEWQAGTHFLLLLPSSGHTFFVTLRFTLPETAKDEDKKTITCPEQLISVSCICMSAKILPYTETLRRGLSKTVQGLRLCLQAEHGGKSVRSSALHFLYNAHCPYLTACVSLRLCSQVEKPPTKPPEPTKPAEAGQEPEYTAAISSVGRATSQPAR